MEEEEVGEVEEIGTQGQPSAEDTDTGESETQKQVEGEEELTQEEREDKIRAAETLKKEGNAFFASGDIENSLIKYNEALDIAPKKCAESAIYYCNAAACHIKLDQYESAKDTCTKALAINEAYIKALMRRCLAYEKLDQALPEGDRKSKIEHIENAVKDAKQWLDLEPNNKEAKATYDRLEGIAAIRREELKDEVMGKLKDLGNTVLGKFGLSLDNFQAQKDPETGSYSINFKK